MMSELRVAAYRAAAENLRLRADEGVIEAHKCSHHGEVSQINACSRLLVDADKLDGRANMLELELAE